MTALATHAIAVQVFKRVVIQPRDAREASDTFLRQAIADVLLTYENEIVLTNVIQPSSTMPYIAPDNNVLVRHDDNNIDNDNVIHRLPSPHPPHPPHPHPHDIHNTHNINNTPLRSKTPWL